MSPVVDVRGGSSDDTSNSSQGEEEEPLVEDHDGSQKEEAHIDEHVETESADDDEPSADQTIEEEPVSEEEVVDLDNAANGVDVRGGSTSDPSSSKGDEDGVPSGTNSTSISDDSSENDDDSHQNESSQQSLEEEEQNEPVSSVPSVPPGGALESSSSSSEKEEQDAEPRNGHTAVSDHPEGTSEEEEEEENEPSKPASVEEVFVEPEPLTPVVVEEAPTEVVDAHEFEQVKVESSLEAETVTESDVSAKVTDAVVAAGDDAASSQIVDAETAKTLMRELQYRRYEVRGMRANIAAIVVEKRLRRPQEGIPLNWYVDESKIPPAWRQQLEDWWPKIVVPIVAGGIGVYLYILQHQQQQQDGSKQAMTFKPVTWIKSIVPVRVSDSTKAVATAPASEATTASSSDAISADAEPTLSSSLANPVDGVAKEHDTHPHSIKPYVHDKPPTEEELDDSWLDKLLTGISKRVKAFFRITL